ncbi:MAG: helix-turn-helix domain-containing protein, partial [Anaeroplasma sp.]
HVVKVIDNDNVLIYLYRLCAGNIEGIVNKSNLKALPSNDYEHKLISYFEYLDIRIIKADYGEIIFSQMNDYYVYYRKPTVEERREIVINFIKRFNGDYIKINTIAKLLGVKTRTMQHLINNLEKEGFIKRTKPEIGEGKV